MKKQVYFVFVLSGLLLTGVTYGQIGFEKGYFIDNSGNRTECLIRNVDWTFNPTFFEYRIDMNGTKQKEVNEVKEFAIENGSRYISAKVKIDMSSDALDDNEISTSFNPEWKEKQVFLKVLVEGSTSLYSYEEQNFVRFFYESEPGIPEQLIYKCYKKPGETSFTYNRSYLNQLFANINCRHLAINTFENISYNASSLINYFQKNNRCLNPNEPIVSTPKKRKWFSLNVLTGFNYSSYRSENSFNPEGNIKYDSKIGFTAGAELEFILPFNNNKWSTVLESSTLSYKSSGFNQAGNKINIDYNTVLVLFAMRYYSFINDKLKVLFDTGFGKDIKQMKVIPTFGIGVSYARLMAQLRYFLERGLYDYYSLFGDKQHFTNLSLTIKYRLF